MGVIQKYINQIKFEEQYYNPKESTNIFYFIAPVEILDGKYPNAVSAEISVECIADDSYTFAPYSGYCEISPTREEPDGSFLDYDWTELVLSNDELDLLFKVYDNFAKKKNG